MKDFVFITGNQHKLDYLAKWLGTPVDHRKIDLDEIQSLDIQTVVKHKAEQAYALVGRPVLVEDVALTFHAMGRLPGTFIRWFLEEMGTEGLCQMMRPFEDKRAAATILYGLYDGQQLRTFGHEVEGTIPDAPRSLEGNEWQSAKSWNSIFIPDSSLKTYAEMLDDELAGFSHRAPAVAKLKAYLQR